MKKMQKTLLVMDLILILVITAGVSQDRIATNRIEKALNIFLQDTDKSDEDKDRQEKKKVALTFDDGPNAEFTPLMLDALKGKNVKATFFLLGSEVERFPEIVKRIHDEGHLIGNHSFKHEQLSLLTSEQACERVNRTNKLIREIIGEDTTYLRPPFGDWKDNLDCEVNMIEVLWDIDTRDWQNQNHSKIVNRVVTKVQENDIILMHDGYEATVSATLEIIDILKGDGYEFVTVDELILE
ncbi:polysaccharide deacetylase family protein [Lachnospiraceae bacterium ZAX-1]